MLSLKYTHNVTVRRQFSENTVSKMSKWAQGNNNIYIYIIKKSLSKTIQFLDFNPTARGLALPDPLSEPLSNLSNHLNVLERNKHTGVCVCVIYYYSNVLDVLFIFENGGKWTQQTWSLAIYYANDLQWF